MYIMTGKVGNNCFIYDTDDGTMDTVTMQDVKASGLPVTQNANFVIPYSKANLMSDGRNPFEVGGRPFKSGGVYYFNDGKKKLKFKKIDNTHVRFSTGIIVEIPANYI